MFHFGHICKIHGLNGHFSIKLCVPEDICVYFEKIHTIYLENNPAPLSISSVVLNNAIFLRAKVHSINSRREAQSILRKNIYIKQGDHEHIDIAINKKNKLLNFKIINQYSEKIGIIKEIDFNNPQPLFIVKSKDKKIMIPYVDELIMTIDEEKKEINLDLPEGLIEICGE